MIGFWLAAAALTAVAVVMLLRPLLRPPQPGVSNGEFAQGIYADQLAEVDRDLARGVLTPEQAANARTEVGRRLLAAAAEAERVAKTQGSGTARPSRKLALALTGLVPVAALGLYLSMGNPTLPAVPFEGRPAAAPPPQEFLDAVAKLERLLQENPNDLQGWVTLAQSYARLDRPADAAEAYRKAVGLSQGDATVLGSFAEALTNAADGMVTEEARRAFEATLQARPDDPRARFYLGVARYQAGDYKGAIDRWAALVADSPADAPWLPVVRQRIYDVASQVGIDPVAATPQPKPPPTRRRRSNRHPRPQPRPNPGKPPRLPAAPRRSRCRPWPPCRRNSAKPPSAPWWTAWRSGWRRTPAMWKAGCASPRPAACWATRNRPWSPPAAPPRPPRTGRTPGWRSPAC
uniref:c-type cytochrome biogenesis protein CcmI n=1 Tax=Aerophototrophica crusticola TaxID=1709002 RepID=UPI00384C8968